MVVGIGFFTIVKHDLHASSALPVTCIRKNDSHTFICCSLPVDLMLVKKVNISCFPTILVYLKRDLDVFLVQPIIIPMLLYIHV